MPKFHVTIFVSGFGDLIVEAKNEAQAREIINAKMDDGDFDPPIDDYSDASIIRVSELKFKQSD